MFRALTEFVTVRLGEFYGGAMMSSLQREFLIFQAGRPGEPFLDAIVAGIAPDGFSGLPGFEDRQ